MYESFYHLRQRPFAAAADINFVVATDAATDAISRLERCVRQARGVGVVTGGAGMGKTLLLHGLVGRLDRDFGVIFVPNGSFAGPRGLLQFLLAEVGEAYEQLGETEMRLRLTAAAAAARASTGGIVLLLDEAHRYTERLFEEVRLMANHIDAGQPLFRIVLAGQMALEEQLAEGAPNGLSERIGEVVTLPRLTTSESRNYLSHRVEKATGDGPCGEDVPRNCIANPSGYDDSEGSESTRRGQPITLDTLFEPTAVDVLIQACGGIPRCLNQLADHALLLGFVAERATVSESLVREALEDLKRLPLQWHDPRPSAGSPSLQEIEADFDDIAPSSQPFDSVVEIGTLDDEVNTTVDCTESPQSSGATVVESDDAVFSETNTEPPAVADACEFSATDEPQATEINTPTAEPPPSLEPVRDRFAKLDADLAEQRWLADWEDVPESSEQSAQALPVANDETPLARLTRTSIGGPPTADDLPDSRVTPPKKTFRVTPNCSTEIDVPIGSDPGWQDGHRTGTSKKSIGNSATLFRDLRRRQG